MSNTQITLVILAPIAILVILLIMDEIIVSNQKEKYNEEKKSRKREENSRVISCSLLENSLSTNLTNRILCHSIIYTRENKDSMGIACRAHLVTGIDYSDLQLNAINMQIKLIKEGKDVVI